MTRGAVRLGAVVVLAVAGGCAEAPRLRFEGGGALPALLAEVRAHDAAATRREDAEAWPLFDWRFVRDPGRRDAEALYARGVELYACARLSLDRARSPGALPRVDLPTCAPDVARDPTDVLPAFDRARAALNRAIELAPAYAAPRLALAQTLDAMGTVLRDVGARTASDALFAEALAEVERALPMVPPESSLRREALDLAGVEYTRALRFADARDAYESLLASPLPDGVRALVLCNLAEVRGDLGELGPAAETFQRCLAVRPGAPDALWGLAVVYDRQGAVDWALGLARQALAADPELEHLRGPGVFFVPACEVHYYLALAQDAAGRPGEAAQEWQAFLTLGGDNGPWAARARAHLARDDARAARATDALLSARSPRRRSTPRRPGTAPATTSPAARRP